jgi:hypothetical protein
MCKLIYFIVTRPNISYYISQISKFMHSPRTSHLDVIDRILRYLKGKFRKEIYFKNNKLNEVFGYSDTYWAGSVDRKSTIGFAHLYTKILSHGEAKNKISWLNQVPKCDINGKRVDVDQTTL